MRVSILRDLQYVGPLAIFSGPKPRHTREARQQEANRSLGLFSEGEVT